MVISLARIFGISSLDSVGEKCLRTAMNVSQEVIVPSKSQKTMALLFCADMISLSLSVFSRNEITELTGSFVGFFVSPSIGAADRPVGSNVEDVASSFPAAVGLDTLFDG